MAFIFAHPVSGWSDDPDAAKAGFLGTNVGYTTTGGRFGGGAFTLFSSASDVILVFPAVATDKVIVHFAAKMDEIAGLEGLAELFNNSGVDRCLEVFCTGSGAVQIEDAEGVVKATSQSGVFTVGAWHVVAIEADIGNASGTVRVWVNGILLIDESAIDMTEGSASKCDKVKWVGDTGDWLLCQVFIYDLSGASPWNAYIGDKRIYPLLPDGDDAVAWAPTGAGTTNADRVDDALTAASDEDSTYVAAATATLDDIYTMADLPPDVTGVISVIVAVEAKKTDAGAPPGGGILEALVKASGGTEVTKQLTAALTTGYVEYQVAFDDEPGGSGWDRSKVDGAKFGPSIP